MVLLYEERLNRLCYCDKNTITASEKHAVRIRRWATGPLFYWAKSETDGYWSCATKGFDVVESAVNRIIEPALEDLGYRLVRTLFSGGQNGRNQLQIMAEPLEDRDMTVEDCEMISRHVAALLDVEDPISSAYVLEVSSPGIDRPLTRLEDFDRFSGELVKVTLRQMRDGRRRFAGRLSGLDDDGGIVVETSFGRFVFVFEDIDSARIDPSEILAG